MITSGTVGLAEPGSRKGQAFGSVSRPKRCGMGSSLSDPCRGSNGGRDVEYGSLSLLFTGLGRRCPSWPPACKSTDAKKTNIAGPRFRPARAPLSQSKISGGQHEKPRLYGRTASFAIPAENEFASPRAGTRPAPVYFFALRGAGCRARAPCARTSDCGRAT